MVTVTLFVVPLLVVQFSFIEARIVRPSSTKFPLASDTNSGNIQNAGENCLQSQIASTNVLQNFIFDNLRACIQNLQLERERLKNCTERTNRNESAMSEDAIIERYKSRFVNITNLDIITRVPSENVSEDSVRVAAIRSWAGIRTSSIASSQEACPTRFRVISPSTLFHISGTQVRLWAPKSRKQLFFIRECSRTVPLVTVSSPTARCETVLNLHKAIIKVQRTNNGSEDGPFNSCTRVANNTYFICDEWVQLGSSCALFV